MLADCVGDLSVRATAHVACTSSIPATGKQFVLKASDTYELQGGKIFRSWTFGDQASLLGQLGLMPPL